MLRDLLIAIIKILAWFWSQPTLKIRISEDNPYEEVGGLKFEVENVGDKATSLTPTVRAKFFTIKRRRDSVFFDIRELERNLPPFTPKLLSASARKVQPQRDNAWYRVYIFLPAKGRACRVRIRNASLESIGFFCFFGRAALVSSNRTRWRENINVNRRI